MEPGDTVPFGARSGCLGKGYSVAITSMTRFKSDKTEEMVKKATQANKIVEKHVAEFLRMSRFHIGQWVGERLVVARYSSWEAFGKAQEGLAKDAARAEVDRACSYRCPADRPHITVSVDLR
jgi:hypothetical protein